MRYFWQWLCGYLCVCIRGRQVNRFLNLCSRNGIHLWRIRYHMEQEIYAHLRFRDFYELKPFLRKTKTRLKIISKKGFPFWCHRHPKLKWFLCLCICLSCIAMYSGNFVWEIQIKGNTRISSDEIMDYLSEYDINIGIKKNVIDCSGIEVMLREQFEELGWVSVYFERTNLCIELKESLYDVLEDTDIEQGIQYDYIANKDAKIVSIVTRKGKAVVEKEQYVKKGDVLVLGLNEIYADSGEIKDILYFKADALIYGDVIYEFLIPLSELEIVSLRMSGTFNDHVLKQTAYRKVAPYVEKLEKNGVCILDKEVEIHKEEKNIYYLVKIYAREQIGINIPVEEVLKHEFE